jgi:hypothetical protein
MQPSTTFFNVHVIAFSMPGAWIEIVEIMQIPGM